MPATDAIERARAWGAHEVELSGEQLGTMIADLCNELQRARLIVNKAREYVESHDRNYNNLSFNPVYRLSELRELLK